MGVDFAPTEGADAATPSASAQAARELPLCVDLDGTLVRGDTLHEQFLRALLRRPLAALAVLFALARGKAALKRRLSEISPPAAERLLYQPDLLEYLRREKQRGRTLVLATAADAHVAEAVAAHLDIFDRVNGSDGVSNLKGAAKAERLVALYGRDGFAYAGNSRADVTVWRQAGEVILVNVPPALDAQMSSAGKVSHRFGAPKAPSRLRSLIRAARVYQWVKNALVFVPMLLGHAMFRPGVLRASLLVFVAFSVTASAVYIINDLFDLDADRAHPRKRRRPFASGDLPLTYGLLGPVLLVSGPLLAWAAVSFQTFLMLLVYIAVTSGYSSYLKKRPLVDVFTLAGLYSIRVLAGGVGARVHMSIWLLGFSLFVFLSLAFLKRTAELRAARGDNGKADVGRGYRLADAELLQIMGVASAFTATMVLSLYLASDTARAQYLAPTWLWLVVPLQLFAVCRLWLSAARGYMTDDPIVYALKDRVCWLVFACVAVVFVLATRGPELSWL
jgi:4-hydroxybenzoate polyprenyltransferase/phosphoserine phosphatase